MLKKAIAERKDALSKIAEEIQRLEQEYARY